MEFEFILLLFLFYKILGHRTQSWSCNIFDQLSYCVYLNSLCLDERGLVLVTQKPSGTSVKLVNKLAPSPLHLPFIGSLSDSYLDNTAWDNLDIPFRSFFEFARYESKTPSKAKNIQGWSLLASFDAQNYNFYHFVNKIQASFIARLYEIEGLNNFSQFDKTLFTQSLKHNRNGFQRAFFVSPSAIVLAARLRRNCFRIWRPILQ